MLSQNPCSSTPSQAPNARRLLVVGNRGGTNVGQSFVRPAPGSFCAAELLESSAASRGPVLLQRLRWRFCDRKPLRLEQFSAAVADWCRRNRPDAVLSTGLAPIESGALRQIGDLGIRRLNFLTDDPWNPAHRAQWFFEALKEYDFIGTPRRANIESLKCATGAGVEFVPFGYDPELFFPVDLTEPERDRMAADVMFAGGADADRIPYISGLHQAGMSVALYGSYWERFGPEMKQLTRGQIDAGELRKAIAAARLALCLVRRANRDGHCMRTFEVPAVGACMLVEETAEHREIFGEEGRTVLYFKSVPEMVSKARRLLDHPDERERLKRTAHHHIVNGRNTYTDRLRTMMAAAFAEVPAA